MITSANVNIICSNGAGNGKTLLARVFVDYLALIGRTSRVFDTDGGHGGIADYFGAISRVVDISRTAGQVELFDSILGAPHHDYIVDLSAKQFSRFFDVFTEIGFEQGAHEAGLRVAVYYILQPTIGSVLSGAGVRDGLYRSRFIPVHSEFLGDGRADPAFSANYQLLRPDRELTLPALGPEASTLVNRPDFSFQNLFTDTFMQVDPKSRGQLCDFLEALHKQFQSVQLTNDLADLKLHGVL
ncbi:MAG: hypothetical protein AAF441_20035 [Pseudomonadota bacterium]